MKEGARAKRVSSVGRTGLDSFFSHPRQPQSQHDTHHCAAKSIAVTRSFHITFEVSATNSSSVSRFRDLLSDTMAAPPDLNAILAALGKQTLACLMRAT